MCFLGTPLLHWYLEEKREEKNSREGKNTKYKKKVQKFLDEKIK